jgi:formylglycine-generating enzyme required for sulfatase activity
MGGLSWLMNNPPLIGGGTTTALEMTNASSPVRFATTQAPTQQPTSTPTATPTSTPDTTTLRTAVRLARRTVTNNADWRPFSWQFAGADMVIVPAGSFRMLDGGGYQQFLEPFWIDRYEVTNAAYRQCVAAGECSAPETSLSTYDDPDFLDFPITGVNWEAARQYAEWRECRLPTEREWEFAARGPSAYNYPWGNGRDATRGNFCDLNCTIVEQKDYGLDDGFAEVAPVTAFPSGASWVGAFNLGGNVAEFTSSAYLPYPYVAADGRENAQTISEFVIRGGAWNHSFDLILERFKVSRGEAQDNVGFRCVRDLHPSDSQ